MARRFLADQDPQAAVEAELIGNSVRALAAVAAIYNTSAGQSIPDNAWTVVNFGTKELDTDNAVTTGAAWKFTVPARKGGLYSVSAVVAPVVPNVQVDTLVRVGVNGAAVQHGTRFQALAGIAGTPQDLMLSALLNLAAGATVAVAVIQISGAARTLEANALSNRICIFRVPGA